MYDHSTKTIVHDWFYHLIKCMWNKMVMICLLFDYDVLKCFDYRIYCTVKAKALLQNNFRKPYICLP